MNRKVAAGVALLGVLGIASESWGAGFALIEQGVSGLGTAYAGAGSVAEDATTIYFNPAGMTKLTGPQAIGALHVIAPSTEFEPETATNVLGMPITGGDGGDAGEIGVVPNFYFSTPIGGGLSAGLGVFVPFGLATSYDKGWVGRYHAVDSEVMTININPALAYKVGGLSLGAGVSAQYIDVNLTNMVDFGLVAVNMAMAGGNLAGANALIQAGVPSNPNADIYADLNADDWGYGFNVGALYEFSENSRLGLSYRSRIKHTVKGDAKFTLQNPQFLQAFGLDATARDRFQKQDVEGTVTLPANAILSAFHRFNDKWAVMADVMWTEWSEFEELVIEFESLPDSVTTENWRDNWRYSAGVTYNPTERLTLRAGAAYDQSVISKDTDRTPRIPDEDRVWTTFGVGYRLSERFNIDFGYAHLFVSDSKLDKTATPTNEDVGRGTLKGEYDAQVNIASLQLTYAF